MGKNRLFIVGAVLLAVGIALWAYGSNLQPTVGEAITNVFDGNFSNKRDLIIYSGMALTVLGALGLLAAILNGKRRRRRS